MNTPLNDDTQQKARDLARKITVAHDLALEIQKELYGHIEDKLLAYKHGIAWRTGGKHLVWRDAPTWVSLPG